MPAEFTVKLVKIGNSVRVSIPKPAIDGLKWKIGDEVKLTVEDSEIRIRKSR